MKSKQSPKKETQDKNSKSPKKATDKSKSKKNSPDTKQNNAKNKSNSKAKNNNNKNKSPNPNDKEQPKKFLYKLDFIYRREKYTLNKLCENILVSKMKKLIEKKLEIDPKYLKYYYKEKELKEDQDKNNLYQMIKEDSFPIIEVKKESLNEQNIISLNTKVNLIYKVKCKPIKDYIDLINQIEQFFKDICIENNYLCEPITTNEYHVCFLCSDHCFQFKRYMMNISRSNDLYKKTKFEILKVDKSLVIEPEIYNNNEDKISENNYGQIEKIVVTDKKTNNNFEIEFRKIKHKENDYFQKEFINIGPYDSINDINNKKIVENKKKSKEKSLKKKKKPFTVY